VIRFLHQKSGGVEVKKVLIFAIVMVPMLLLPAALDYSKVESLYRGLVSDFLTNKKDPFVSFVDSQLSYMALYRFYKIKMVGSVDRREAALSSSNFLSALITDRISSVESVSDMWKTEAIYSFWKIEELCGEEENSGFGGFFGGFGGFGGSQTEDSKKKLKECLEKVISSYGNPPEEKGAVDFNDLFSKAMFLAYVEAYLKHTNPTPSSIMASIPLSAVYSVYARYVTSDMKKAVKHVLLYYSSLIDEPLPFEIKGLEIRKCEKCGGFKYKDQSKLSFIERDYSYNGLSLKEVLKNAVDFLAGYDFKNEEDFNWKLRMVSFFIYDDMMRKNLLGKPIYRNLKDNMIDILSHTMAYYLGATKTKPPIELDIDVKKINCNCKYEMFRYSAKEDLEKLFENPKVVSILKSALDEMLAGNVKDFEKFSNDTANDVIDALGLENTKQDLASIAAKAAPKRINLWWIRYLAYGALMFIGWKLKKLELAVVLSVIIEIAYIALFMDPISLGEGLLYSLLAFFTFAFAMMLSLGKIKKSWPLVIASILYIIIIFMPEYIGPENLSMDKNKEILTSKFSKLLINDLYDGEKYREFLKEPLTGFFSDSELGRTIDKLISSKNPIKTRAFKKAKKLTERIAKYSTDDLRRDFLDFLKKRINGKPELRKALTGIVESYLGKPAKPPSVINSQTLRGLKAAVIFALVFFLMSVGIRSIFIGIASLLASIYLMFTEGTLFVEYGVPTLDAHGFFVPWIQLLLLLFSIYKICKSLRRRVKA
jgi:hypothetical protein